MQNIQDVENSKKIVLVDDELTKTTNGIKMGTDSEEKYGNLDIGDFLNSLIMLNGTFCDPVALLATYNVTRSLDFMLFVPLTFFSVFTRRSSRVINRNLTQFHPCYRHVLEGS
jgi:hypothetical protein